MFAMYAQCRLSKTLPPFLLHKTEKARVFHVFSLSMAANDESTSEFTGTDDSEEEEQEVKEVKTPKSKKKGQESEATDLGVQKKKKIKCTIYFKLVNLKTRT